MIAQTRKKALMKPDLSNEAVENTQEFMLIAPVYVDTNTTKTLHLLGAQINAQL